MEDDFDIYEDLDFGKKKHEDNWQKQQNDEELLGKVEKLEERVKHLEAELTNAIGQKQILETNFSSLLKTAKNELSRKDRMIFDLRAQIDNFYFRRNKDHIQKDTNTKNKSNNLEVKKDQEPISKCRNEETQEKLSNFDKSLPLYLSPGPQFISRLESLSDDEDTGVICHSNKLVSTVFGERLKKRLKDQEQKERLQIEQAKSLTSVSQSNETADTKTEVKAANINNMDNKENHYRLISLESPKNNLKRRNEDKSHEVLDKRKKYSEPSEASQSCKSDERDNVENSRSRTDKFIDTNMHTNEYFCSTHSGNDALRNVDKYHKKSPEYDRGVRSSKHVDKQEDDRYKKYRDNDYKDNRSKSRSTISSDSEKNYSYVNRGRNRGRGRYSDGRDKKNYYSKEDDFSRNQSRSRIDSRNHHKQWKNNEAVYESDVNERRYPDEQIYGEVRRSRRIEAKSHSRYTDYREDSNYYNRDNHKDRRYEEKDRTRRRSRSHGRSRERNSADSTSSRKNDCERTNHKEEDQLKLNKNLEEEEIEDDSITDKEMNILKKILEGSEEASPKNVFTPVFQSPREERIENIQEFIQKYDNANPTKTVDNKNVEKNIDSSTDIKLKKNENKDIHRNKCDLPKEEKKESIQKPHLDEQIINIDIKNIEKVGKKENKISQDILIENKEQPQNPKLELLNNINSKSVNNNEELTENNCNTNEAKIVHNEDKNNLDMKLEIIISSTENKSTIDEKAKMGNKDSFAATRDPEYCKILSKYLKKKPEHHNSEPSKTSTNVSTVNEENTKKKNVEKVISEPVENIKSKKCEREEPKKIESDNSSTENKSTIDEKAKMENKDSFAATRDPEYCKILPKYLKKKPEQHNSEPSKTSPNVSTVDEENTKKKNVEIVPSEPVENIKSEKCEREEPKKIESDKCSKTDISLKKSGESSLPSTSSVLTIVCKPEPTAESADKKVKNDECFVSPISKNAIKRTVNKNKINVKNPSTSSRYEAKKVITTRKKKEKIDENQNSNKTEGVMILATRRRPMRLSDFSSSVTVVSTVPNVDSNQVPKAKLEVIKG